MGRPHVRGERTLIKLALGILFGLILFIFLCWGGYRLYAGFESKHLARRGAAYLSGGDVRQATLSARRALQIDPTNIAAIRVAAEAAERANVPLLVGHHRRHASVLAEARRIISSGRLGPGNALHPHLFHRIPAVRGRAANWHKFCNWSG